MMQKDSKIYVAGHRGMVGSAIIRELQRQGYTNIITRTHKELDLCRQDQVERFFAEEKPEYVFLAVLYIKIIRPGLIPFTIALSLFGFSYSHMSGRADKHTGIFIEIEFIVLLPESVANNRMYSGYQLESFFFIFENPLPNKEIYVTPPTHSTATHNYIV